MTEIEDDENDEDKTCPMPDHTYSHQLMGQKHISFPQCYGDVTWHLLYTVNH